MAKKPIKKKFWNINIPLTGEDYEAHSYTLDELQGKSIKLDMSRRLKGKGVDLILTIKVSDGKAFAIPKKMTLQSFFIRHMLRKSISYVEDSFAAESKESKIIIKPYLLTRKKVSRAVRRTLRNSARNWIEDYTKTKTNEELFAEIMDGQMQRPLSLKLKKIYPLALCEIRDLEIKSPLVASMENKSDKPLADSREDPSKKPLGVLDKEEQSEEPKINKKKKKGE